MCLVDRNGNLVVDYGWMTWNGKTGYFNGTEISFGDNFFAGDDGVCFTQGKDVYFFGSLNY